MSPGRALSALDAPRGASRFAVDAHGRQIASAIANAVAAAIHVGLERPFLTRLPELAKCTGSRVIACA